MRRNRVRPMIPMSVVLPFVALLFVAGAVTAASQSVLAWSLWPSPEAMATILSLPCSMISLALPFWYLVLVGYRGKLVRHYEGRASRISGATAWAPAHLRSPQGSGSGVLVLGPHALHFVGDDGRFHRWPLGTLDARVVRVGLRRELVLDARSRAIVEVYGPGTWAALIAEIDCQMAVTERLPRTLAASFSGSRTSLRAVATATVGPTGERSLSR